MVIQLKPHMADLPAAIWAHLEKHNAQVIRQFRENGKVPHRDDLDKIARMIGHYRRTYAVKSRG